MNGEAKRQQVYDRLVELQDEGRLTADAVVTDARKVSSPLHGEFEWDDTAAAKRYRTDQARRLIAHVKIYIERTTYVITAPAYVRDPEAGGREQGYRSTAALKTDHDLALDALVTEAGRAAAYLDRVRALASALELEDELASVLDGFATFRIAVMAKQ